MLFLLTNACLLTNNHYISDSWSFLLNVDFEEVYILNDSDFHLKKKIDFEDAINVNNNFLIENLKGKSKSYYNVENLKKNIKEIHNNNFFESM